MMGSVKLIDNEHDNNNEVAEAREVQHHVPEAAGKDTEVTRWSLLDRESDASEAMWP